MNPAPIPAPKLILAEARKALDSLREAIAGEERVFLTTTLPHRLKMGLHCLKAHVVFAVKDPGKRGQGRKPKEITSRRDVISPEGFEGWLAAECPWLKKPTAYKYMTALKGLGLSELATEADVEEACARNLRLGPVTIASLCAAALDAIGQPAPPPARLLQSEFEFLKQGLSSFREETEHLLQMKHQLADNPDCHRAACARLYSTLVELTGTNWQPSDEPDELANVDPDAITI